jgi:hypothetical protein
MFFYYLQNIIMRSLNFKKENNKHFYIYLSHYFIKYYDLLNDLNYANHSKNLFIKNYLYFYYYKNNHFK